MTLGVLTPPPLRRHPVSRDSVWGLLRVLRLEHTRRGRRLWRCSCSCGRHVLVETRYLTGGDVKTCGSQRCNGRVRVEAARRAQRDERGQFVRRSA